MSDQFDPIDEHMSAQRDDTARKMQERRQAKERRNQVKSTPPPPPIGERRHSKRRTTSNQQKSGSGILGKLTFILVLGVSAGAGYTYYQQDLMVKSLSQTNEATSLRIAELEAQLRASDTLLEQSEDVVSSTVSLTKTEIRRLWENSNQNKTLSANNKDDVENLQSSIKSIDKKISSLNTKDAELVKKDDGIRWLANQAKNEADAAKEQLDELSTKIGKIDAISKKVALIDGLSKKVSQIDGLAMKVTQIDDINEKISIIDELEMAIDSIKPTDVSGIKSNQSKIINAQNTLLNDQASLEVTQSNIKLALELITDRITSLESAIDVIDNHRMRIQQDLADLKQTP